MQDESIYRCVNPACARAMPRPVNFCPWCGTAQGAAARALEQERGARDAADQRDARRAALAAAGASAAASLAGWSDAPDLTDVPAVPDGGRDAPAPAASRPQDADKADKAGKVPAGPAAGGGAAGANSGVNSGVNSGAPAATPVRVAAPEASPTSPSGGRATPAGSAPSAASSTHAFGRNGTAGPGAMGKSAPAAGAGPGKPPGSASRRGVSGGASTPRQREPIRLRWWILALAVLWGVWLMAKPSAKKNERRIEAAIGLARECKAKEAQDELIALRSSRATPAQLKRLQKALNAEAAKCTRRRQKEKAWLDAENAVETALKAGNVERARTRLQAFAKRWGEDEDTRALRERIDAARREHPLAVPRPPGGSGAARGSGGTSGSTGSGDAQSARNLVREARADLARGAFNAAGDKMTLCLTMVDPGNRECATLKAQAEREGKMQ